jgi:dTMP kinase
MEIQRDRFEESDRAFFERVAVGYRAIAGSEPNRVRVIDAGGSLDDVRQAIWSRIQHVLARH